MASQVAASSSEASSAGGASHEASSSLDSSAADQQDALSAAQQAQATDSLRAAQATDSPRASRAKDPYNKIEVTAIDDLDSAFEKYTNPHVKELRSFLEDPRKTFLTKKGDPEVNFINQKYKKNYVIPEEDIGAFFVRYEKCRLNKVSLNYAERQGSEALPYSGIMLDYDCIIDTEKFELHHLSCYEMVSIIVEDYLTKHLTFPSTVSNFQIFATVRPITTKKEPGYKTGFHILIPGVKTLRSYKKYLISRLKDDPAIHSELKRMGIRDPEKALDLNSASVPPLFLGSCKPGGVIYDLKYAFNVNMGRRRPVITEIQMADIKQYNLAWELSFNYEAKYCNDMPPLVQKHIYKVIPELENEVIGVAERAQGNLIKRGHIEDTAAEVEDLRRTKPQADMLCRLLELLPESSYQEYHPWRNIIFAIANTSKHYYCIAKWFSQRCPDKYSEPDLRRLWDEVSEARYAHHLQSPITFATIKYMAKQANEERYKQIISQDAVHLLAGWAWKYSGDLHHYQIAKLIYILFSHKFKVDQDMAGKSMAWYEFIMPGDRMEDGETWKWRARKTPFALLEYISEGLEHLCDLVKDSIQKKENEAKDEESAKRIKAVLKQFKKVNAKIFDHAFKVSVIKESEQLFIDYGFTKKLDRNGSLFGVANGIVVLGQKCKILNRFHEHLISKFSPVRAIPFDPKNPMTKLALDMFRSAIPEKDARLKLVMFWASCLDGYAKDPELAILTGSGGNAKTTHVQCVNKCFGPEYGVVMNAQLLTKDIAAADKPNSQIATMENARMIMMEETNRDEALNPAMVKKLVNPGDLSNRDLHSKQRTFKITSKITLVTNHDPKLDIKDGGLKRRIFYYRYKCTFVRDPEPGTYQRKGDPHFIKEYPDNPDFQSALLSVLIYFYEVLQTVYNGDLKNVPSPTIDRETEEFFNKHDLLGQFITERIVISPHEGHEYQINTVVQKFKEWVKETEDVKTQQGKEDIAKDIEDSIMLSKYIETATNGVRMLRNCRILEKSDSLRVGEQYISHVKTHQMNRKKPIVQDIDDEWWVIPEYERYINAEDDEEEKQDPNDDIIIMNAERKQKKKEVNETINDLLETLGDTTLNN
jgi:phage/plasmid-associated DNA primase